MGNQTFAHRSSRGDGAHGGGTSAAPRNAVRRSGPYAVQESATYRRDAPANLSPRVLYVSETLLAVDKPAGIIVHGDGTGTKTLTDLVRSAVERGTIDHVAPTCAAEAQALQRLDRDTTGIVLFSICKRTQGVYDALIAGHGARKNYLAVAEGRIPWDQRDIRVPIGRDRHDARRMRASRTGKDAHTEATVLDRRRIDGRWYTLLDLRLYSGRKHQIRVHLAHEGFPLVGDALYGAGDARGLMLHARRFTFTDPVSRALVDIHAPIPKRFRDLFPRSCARLFDM